MEIRVHARSRDRRELIEAAARFYAQELGLERSRYSLDIITQPGLIREENSRGTCSKLGPNCLVMCLESRLDMDTLLQVLAHEMVHAKQFARGQLRTTVSRAGNTVHYWKGRRVRASYYDQPWEQEAFSRERLLANKIYGMM
jgi:hypothetical protein